MRWIIRWLASFFGKGKSGPSGADAKAEASVAPLVRGTELFRDGAYSVTRARFGLVPWLIVWEDDPVGGEPQPVEKRALLDAAVCCARELAAADTARLAEARAIWDRAAGK